MILTNYHMHCTYCDGKNSPQEMVDAAKERGFKAVGFSSHAPLPFENDFCMLEHNLESYVAEISSIKQVERDIEVYLGLEFDYVPGYISPTDEKWKKLNLDYCIGSVHTLDAPNDVHPMLSVDGPEEQVLTILNDVFDGDEKAMVTAFYDRVRELCEVGGFDILGHYDLIKKRNKALQFFDEDADWYREIAASTLDAVAKAGVIIDVNYGGMLRRATDEVYPALWLLKEAKARNIPVQINADAHATHHLGVHHELAREVLLEAGYTEQRVLLEGRWQDIEL